MGKELLHRFRLYNTRDFNIRYAIEQWPFDLITILARNNQAAVSDENYNVKLSNLL